MLGRFAEKSTPAILVSPTYVHQDDIHQNQCHRSIIFHLQKGEAREREGGRGRKRREGEREGSKDNNNNAFFATIVAPS